MSQATINLRIDANLKKELERIFNEMGLNLTTAFTIFANKVASEKRMPFEISSYDLSSDKKSMDILKSRIDDMDIGRNTTEHELIEV